MELFWLEHKKLWRKRIVKICVLLCFIYVVIIGNILIFQWFGFGSSADYLVAISTYYCSCRDWHSMYAICCKELVKKDEGLITILFIVENMWVWYNNFQTNGMIYRTGGIDKCRILQKEH